MNLLKKEQPAIIIDYFAENMHYFVAEISQLDVPSLTASSRRAEAIFDENLVAYIKIVFRRPFGKIIVSICHRDSPLI